MKRKATDSTSTAVTLQDDDHDLDCCICISLVLNATQSKCCGTIFCKACIDEWLKNSASKKCPHCQASIQDSEKDLMPDVRTERKSSERKRHCKYHANLCTFIGTRKEVEEHEPVCQHVPVDDLKREMEELKNKNKSLERKIFSLEDDVRILTNQQSKNSKNLESMKDYFVEDYNVVKFFYLSDDLQSYNLKYSVGSINFRIEISIEDQDVSLYLFVQDNVRNRIAAIDVDITICLFHLDNCKYNRMNHVSHLSHRFEIDEATGYGYPAWMKLTEFQKYVKNGRFAVGV